MPGVARDRHRDRLHDLVPVEARVDRQRGGRELGRNVERALPQSRRKAFERTRHASPIVRFDPAPEAHLVEAVKNNVVGTNNHMGSVMTADATRMRWVLEEVRDRRLFFIDSRTTARSVAATLSREMGIPSASRRVFLDDSRGFADIEREWARALRYADTEGSALIIGHVYPETLAALRLLVARDRARVTLVRARALAR